MNGAVRVLAFKQLEPLGTDARLGCHQIACKLQPDRSSHVAQSGLLKIAPAFSSTLALG